MSNSRQPIFRRALAAAFVASLALTNRDARAADYYIDESTDFTGNGCDDTDLNDITSQLQSALISDGRSGSRFTNASAWPHDFMESCNAAWYGTGGLDHVYGDASSLSVYAGHGNKNYLHFGFARNGVCGVTLTTNVRLGRMNGGQSTYAIYGTSCTMAHDTLSSGVLYQAARQQFGFHNSPDIADDDVGEFYNESNLSSNKNSWLDNLEDRPGWFTGDNSPMVVSKGWTDSDALSVHNNFAFRAHFWDPPMGGLATCGGGLGNYYWYYTYIDHGGC